MVGADTPVALDAVSKRYGDVVALEEVTLSLDTGHVHGVVGPNGSGKTTLFHLIVGLTRPTSGEVSRSDATVGFSFQEPRFYPSLTVRENLEAFRALADDPPPADWIDELVESLRLDPVDHRVAAALSGGFRRKLDLGLALVKQPDLVLLDEPLDDVDTYSRDLILEFLQEYADQGNSVVVSTHQVEVFAGVFDRLSVFVDGSLEFDGDAAADPVAQYREHLPS